MTFLPATTSHHVLLIEDEFSDILLTQSVFEDTNRSICLSVASDGIDAMDFLNRQAAHGRAPRPDLILLDLSLPKLDGREVLARIKSDSSLKSIPTIILTASEAKADIIQCYQLQANVYLTKPTQQDLFKSVLKGIIGFWLTRAKLPHSVKTEEV
jgi:two-component system response regulator